MQKNLYIHNLPHIQLIIEIACNELGSVLLVKPVPKLHNTSNFFLPKVFWYTKFFISRLVKFIGATKNLMEATSLQHLSTFFMKYMFKIVARTSFIT